MNYITSKNRKSLTNEPYILSSSELREMIRLNHLDIEETKKVTESSNRGETYYNNDGYLGSEKVNNFLFAFLKETLYRDRKTDGFIMKYPHGIVISQGTHNSYYRGENQIYDSSLPSLYRSLEKLNEDEKKIYRFVTNMRIAEFQIFLNKLEIVKFWQQNYGTVLYEPLAQHYGIETEWLDITSNLDVALFFATCKYDVKSQGWYPLTTDDTEKNEKTRYGVVFYIPGWQAETDQLTCCLTKKYNNVILPIGYQPFMRCHSQHGYGICMKKPFPLQDDYKFEKLRFRHDEQFSKEIYKKMDCGKKIYPKEGLELFDDVIDRIKTTTVFNKEAYKIALDKELGLSETDIQTLIKKCNCKKIFGSEIIISDEEAIKISRQKIRACNRKYAGFSIEKDYGIKLLTRLAYV